MDDILRRLELQIKMLLASQGELKQINTDLNHKTHKLTQDKAALIDKQHKAITQIKSLIVKLKALERLP